MFTLYLKIHNKTGLKYLGKTVKDPSKYIGSGVRWCAHLKKHGYNVSTMILFETEDEKELRQKAIEYSEKFNVVENPEFANLMVEQGSGGDTWSGRKHTEESKALISKSRKGKGIGSCPSKGRPQSIKRRKEISEFFKERHKGTKNPAYGRKWWNNGVESVLTHKCPEGFVKGRLPWIKNKDI